MAKCQAACRIALLLATFALAGCATYSDSFGVIERNLSAQQYDAALQDIEKQSKSKNGLVLYLPAKGMVRRMKRDDAGVGALQVDIKLREIGEKIPESKFTEDALSRYLTGMIYEELGEWSDAMIAYRKAYEAYKKYQVNYGLAMPDMLKHDLLRLAQRQGLKDEAALYRKEFGIEPQPKAKNKLEQEGQQGCAVHKGVAPL